MTRFLRKTLLGTAIAAGVIFSLSSSASAFEMWVFVKDGQFRAYSSRGECSNAQGDCELLNDGCAGRYAIYMSPHAHSQALNAYKNGSKVNVTRISNNEKLCSYQK